MLISSQKMKPNLFNSVKLTRPKKNVFDLSHDVKLTAQMGNLVPVLAMEVVPTDQINLGSSAMIRFAPLLAPIMHRVDVSIHYFMCPNRLLWPNWEEYITNVDSGFLHPTIVVDNSLTDARKKFLDYMGIPPVTGLASFEINALPIAAYNKIYNEYYRDQNLVGEILDELIDGPNPVGLIEMQKRAWEHDYFTSALPFAQKGTAVDIPLGEVVLNPDWFVDGQEPKFVDTNGVMPTGSNALQNDPVTGNVVVGAPADAVAYDPDGSLTTAPTTINDLRRAFKLQEWLERNARGGTRYIESILAHFGYKGQDARLQRPEYICGVKAPIVISEVLNTSGTFAAGDPADPTSPVQGNMAGHGVSVASGKNGNYFVHEHGWIIGIMSVMPKPAYQQGVPKSFIKQDQFDYYWPTFAHIGEQEIRNIEIFAESTTPNDVFGYTPRYAEYKYMANRVAGDFRSSLNYWHLGRVFASQPNLNQEFIECDPADLTRIFAVIDENQDNLYCHLVHQIKAVRPMPVFGTPTF